MKTFALTSVGLLLLADSAYAESGPTPGKCLSQPGAEKQDDKTEKFPAPPDGYDTRRDGISRGKLETVEYDSTTVGVKRKAKVYTPPGYTPDQKYPVLYLLHGIGGDENEWGRGGVPDVILDNLYADKKVVPMIVVMPNGRASKDVTARDPIPKQSPAFAKFEKDLLTDLIPFIEKSYSVNADRESRALAGLSMGGGQSLNFGLGNLDTFAWVGGFSSAPNTKPPAELIKDPAEATKKLRLLYVACGDKDGLFRISENVHKMLDEKKVPHLYNVIPGGRHDFQVWKCDLYHFSQLLFRSDIAVPTAAQNTETPAQSKNKQTVQKYMDAFGKTDHAAILSCLSDDVEWVIPGAFRITGKTAFDKEIENDAFVGSPVIKLSRMMEEADVVVAEGSVGTTKKDGGVLNLLFCDIFEMREGKIKRLTSYLVEIKDALPKKQ